MTNELITFNPDQLDLIKRTIAKDATNDELALFIHQCERTGLDPMNKQIYFQKYSGKMTIITAIDGFRLIAQRTGQYAGGGETMWCGEDGIWRDIWPSDKAPVAAKVVVKKVVGGLIVETAAVAHYSEYVVKYGQKVGDMWVRMPRNQLAKCAEALALRKAFPAELSGLYTSDEMGQAETVVTPVEYVKSAPVAQPALPAHDPQTGEILDITTTSPTTTSRTFPPPATTVTEAAQRMMQVNRENTPPTDKVDAEVVKALITRIGKLGSLKELFTNQAAAASLSVPRSTRAPMTAEHVAKLEAIIDGLEPTPTQTEEEPW